MIEMLDHFPLKIPRIKNSKSKIVLEINVFAARSQQSKNQFGFKVGFYGNFWRGETKNIKRISLKNYLQMNWH